MFVFIHNERATGSRSLICRAGFARRVYPRPSAGSGEDHTRSVRSKGKQRHLFCEQRPSPVHQAWEHQSPVRGPIYRHTDSLPTDPTWRPDLRGVEGILGRRDIVIRFLLSGLHPLAPPGRSELESKIWRRKARGERRNGSQESLLVLLDQFWVRSRVIRADFRAGASAYPLTLSPLCPVVPDDLQIFCKQTLAGLRRRPQLEKLHRESSGERSEVATLVQPQDGTRDALPDALLRAPALDISMEPSRRSGVAPPPNSPRGSEDSRSTEPNTLDMGPVPTLSPVRVAADRERPDAARPAVGRPHTDRRPIIPRPPPTGRDSHGHLPPVKLIFFCRPDHAAK
ncbi:hypothetical protein ACLKA7_001966 [Drosophila subpalustris]